MIYANEVFFYRFTLKIVLNMWEQLLRDFEVYISLERSLADNTGEAYLRDIAKLRQFLQLSGADLPPQNIEPEHITSFFVWLNEFGIAERSQARILSGLKTFFKFLINESIIEHNPVELFETPRIPRYLPDVLSIEEIDKILAAIDLSIAEGQRNKAMIETLYSCGLRVSELVSVRLSNIHPAEGYIRIVGKGDKERFVPVSDKALKEINLYIESYRIFLNIPREFQDFLFLNRFGKTLTRVMVFTFIKKYVGLAGIQKNVSPHTFRHSFATHLIDGGADLRAVQQMLGHESITTTEIYTHLDRDYLRNTLALYHPRVKKG